MIRPGRILPAFVLGLAALIASPAAAEGAEGLIDQARADCASFENGGFTVASGAVTYVDFDNDGKADAVVDQSKFACSAAASFWCGTGGCGLIVVVGGKRTDLLVKDWRVIDWHERKILLTAIHGANCGGTGLGWCYEALVWSEGAMRGIGPYRQPD